MLPKALESIRLSVFVTARWVNGGGSSLLGTSDTGISSKEIRLQPPSVRGYPKREELEIKDFHTVTSSTFHFSLGSSHKTRPSGQRKGNVLEVDQCACRINLVPIQILERFLAISRHAKKNLSNIGWERPRGRTRCRQVTPLMSQGISSPPVTGPRLMEISFVRNPDTSDPSALGPARLGEREEIPRDI